MIDSSFFQCFIFSDFSTMQMGRKFVLAKKLQLLIASLKHSFNSGLEKEKQR